MPTALTMSEAKSHLPEYITLPSGPMHMNYTHLTQSMDSTIFDEECGKKSRKMVKMEQKPVVVRQRRPGGGKAQTPSVLRRNERERNRVKLVNDGFLVLRQHVPGVSRSKKLSKVDTLRAACDYIQHLQSVLNGDSPITAALGTLPASSPPPSTSFSSTSSPSSSPTSPLSPSCSVSSSSASLCLTSSSPIQSYYTDSGVEPELYSTRSSMAETHQGCVQQELAAELSGFGTWFS